MRIPLPFAPRSLLAAVAFSFSLAARGAAAEGAGCEFRIPAGTAEKTLKLFAQQSRLEILFQTDTVAGVRTQPVIGHRPCHSEPVLF